MTPTAGADYDITLTSGDTIYGFMVLPGSFHKERADDFAPRIATGEDTTLREGIWNAWAQSGASAGVDQLTFTSRDRIYRNDGNVFTSRHERIMLAAAWNSSAVAVALTAPMFVDFSTGTNYAVGAKGDRIHRLNLSTEAWSASATTLGASCVWLHRHGTRMFAACGSGTDFYSSTDLDTFAQPAAGERAAVFATWEYNNTVYLMKGVTQTIKGSSDNGVNWGAGTSVGNADSVITGMGVANGLLLIGKEDGLWSWDGVSVTEILSFPNKRYAGNFRAIVMHNDGFLYTHVLGQIIKLSFAGGGVANMVAITPEMVGSEVKELYGHGIPVWMWSGPESLYCAFDDGESVYPEVMSYNGMGWHQEYRGTSGDNMLAGGYSRLGSRTLIDAADILWRKHPTLRDLPFPDYPATGVFETSDYDAGLPFEYKAFRDVSVEVENVTTGSGSILVDYSADRGTTWATLGTIVSSGKNVLFFASTQPVPAQQLRLRFTITRNSSSSSPRIRRYSTTFIIRPTPIYVYSLQLKIGPAQILRDQTAETESVLDRLGFLDQAEGSRTPVTFADMYGGSRKVYITRTSQRYLPESLDNQNGVVPEMDLFVEVTMIQVNIGGLWDQVYWDSFVWL